MKTIDKVLKTIASDGIIIDIGANIGYTSIRWAKEFPNAKVYSFELMAPTYAVFMKNIEINQVSENIVAYNFGVSDKNGDIDCFYYPWTTANSSIQNLQEREDAIKIKANCVRLDDFDDIKDLAVDFIKVDVEGAEYPAFKGMRKLLEKNKPVVVSELLRIYSAKHGYHPNEVLDYFSNQGYMCIGLDDKLEAVSDMSETGYRNFIFLHMDKHSSIISSLL